MPRTEPMAGASTNSQLRKVGPPSPTAAAGAATTWIFQSAARAIEGFAVFLYQNGRFLACTHIFQSIVQIGKETDNQTRHCKLRLPNTIIISLGSVRAGH